jgi:hypothetical protein
MGVDLEATLYALDSTTIELWLGLFDWAPFRSTNAAVKMHSTLRNASMRHIPEAGAVCGNSAHTDLCWGAGGNLRPYRNQSTGLMYRPN